MSAAISFARGAPAPQALSADLVADCTARALSADGVRMLSYGAGGGYPPLRELLAQQNGVSPEQVVITNGSLQGFVFLLESLFQPGDRIAVEAPTYDRALLQLTLHDMDVQPIPVEADGMAVDVLASECAAGRVPKLVYTISNFQNPSGVTLSLDKRRALVELSEKYDFLILEDDPYGRLRFEGDHLPGFRELGDPDRILFTSSFSKIVAPGLRVGWIVAPEAIAAQLAAAASRTYISASFLAQGALHQLCDGGHLEGNIAHVTQLMRERRDAMLAGLPEFPEGTVCHPPEGGFFLWAELPEGMSADALHAPAADAGVLYVKGSDCVVAGGERTFRLAYSGVSPDEIGVGMRRLGEVFSAAT